ncbi:CbrC family protein [Aquimarina sediminis]|uniref:CbrC family protein n=1 Tax=Aquimarina sediminis TaxID=2070536 RepID=UPI000CA03D6C|nr:CbrC family protein [Aquimarina sediminis]
MDYINQKYFKASIEETPFESNQNNKACSFCRHTKSPSIQLDDSLTIISRDANKAEIVCLQCFYEKKYSFEQQAEGGYLTKDGILLDSEKYNYLKDSHDYDTDLLPKEKQLLSIEKSKIQELQHTPPFNAWQGAIWLVHCNDFMTFIGTWEHKDFVNNSPNNDPSAFFDNICDNWNGDDFYDNQFGPNKSEYAESTFYAFECMHCKKKRGYVDNG